LSVPTTAAGTYHALLWETAAPEPAAGACVLLGLVEQREMEASRIKSPDNFDEVILIECRVRRSRDRFRSDTVFDGS
jgi:hypothetical protein